MGSGTLTGWVNRPKPYYTALLEDGRYGDTWTEVLSQQWHWQLPQNGKNHIGEDNIVLNLSGEYEDLESLKYRGTVGVSKRNQFSKKYLDRNFHTTTKKLFLKARPLGFGGFCPICRYRSFNRILI